MPTTPARPTPVRSNIDAEVSQLVERSGNRIRDNEIIDLSTGLTISKVIADLVEAAEIRGIAAGIAWGQANPEA